MAFAFNMVDCGGLLGGRLGSSPNAAALRQAAADKQHTTPALAKRTFTL